MAKVLVVDDDPIVRTILSRRLEAGGHQVLMESDGEAGWAKVREQRPDVVILDLMMPKMHGYAVIEAIRRDPGLAHVRIIVCSMKGYASDARTALNMGADRYLTKPVPPDQMAAAVDELVGADRRLTKAVPPDQESAQAEEPADTARTVPATPLAFRVRFWGTRGSVATPGRRTLRYGGNTSCTEVRHGDHILLLDAGTGIRELGDALLSEFQGKPIRAHIFVGHTHWDHIQGFPFFTPAYIPGNEFSLYSARGAGKSLQKIFMGQMDSDYFPVLLTDMRSTLRFIELSDPVQIGPITVRFDHLNHPGIAIGFRISAGERTIVYLSDHERFSRMYGEAAGAAEDGRITEFARGADLLICEAQYTEEEYKYKKGWGHSTFDDAIRLAAECGAKRLAIFHHDPDHDDAFLDGVKTKAAAQHSGAIVAAEGLTLRI